MFLNKLFFILMCNTLIFTLKAQVRSSFSVETNMHFGNIIRHTPKLTLLPSGRAIGEELHLNWQLKGQQPWHEWQRFPSVGLSLLYLDLGEPRTLGAAIGLFPTVDLKILRSRPLSILVQVGTGIAYLTRHYDQVDNPTNNGIGSALNCMAHLKLKLETPLSSRLKLQIGGSFTHFSNGAAHLPNFGINVPALDISLRYHVSSDTEGVFIRHFLSKKATKKYGLTVQAGMALSETGVPRGPQYPIYGTSLSVYRNISRINRLHLGVSYEQNRVVAEYGLHAAEFKTQQEAWKGGERVMGFVEEEFLFGNVGLLLQTGVYSKKYKSVRSNWYNKLGVRVYMPPIGRPKTQLFVGFYLKAHLATAEYLAFVGGATF